jgi:hypothetical protein
VFGWDQAQARSWNGICRHTTLSALAQLRAAAIRGALTGTITLPATSQDGQDTSPATRGDDQANDSQASDADPRIPLGDAPVPPGIAPIRLSIAETARLASLATRYTAGLITRARLAFALRWSLRRRRHQAAARWHHYSTRLKAVTDTS